MAKIEEASKTEMQGGLDAGLKAVSGNQKITFKKYSRAVLPLDGYVFWVRDLVAAQIEVSGSLHYQTDQQQRPDETIGLNKVVFTTQEQIQEFNSVSRNEVYIGQIDDIRFAFTSQGRKYVNAGTYHYSGDAIYPAMLTQIIENPDVPIDLGAMIATNSLPIWLGLNQFMDMYPANLIPTNIPAPYAAIEISNTNALQVAPLKGVESDQHQLMTEMVKITMYGLRNNEAMDFMDYVFDFTGTGETIGIQNMPALRDESRGQSELGVIAQKKVVEFEINYYQSRARAVARRLIYSAGISVAV